MSVSKRLIELFEAGYKPADVVKMGFPKSTVYAVYRKWLEGRVGEDFIYIAHDIDYVVVRRLSDQLNLLGYKTLIGGNSEDTLAFIKPARAVIGIASEKPGVRRHLLLEELYEASRLAKPTYVLVEEGTRLPTYNNIKIIELSKQNPQLVIQKLVSETRRSELGDLIAAIVLGAIVILGIATIIKLLEDIFSKNR